MVADPAASSFHMRAIDILDNGLSRNPRGFIRDGVRSYGHAGVRAISHQIANGLRAAGLQRGSRVGFYSPNSAIAFVALIGVLRAGAVWQPVHSRNPSQENIEFLAENGCEFLFYHSKLADDVAKFRSGQLSA